MGLGERLGERLGESTVGGVWFVDLRIVDVSYCFFLFSAESITDFQSFNLQKLSHQCDGSTGPYNSLSI